MLLPPWPIASRRLSLASNKFCRGYSAGSVISSLDYVASYVQYQSGSGILVDAADYILAQVNGLIGALNDGVVVCCSAPAFIPANPGPGVYACFSAGTRVIM